MGRGRESIAMTRATQDEDGRKPDTETVTGENEGENEIASFCVILWPPGRDGRACKSPRPERRDKRGNMDGDSGERLKL